MLYADYLSLKIDLPVLIGWLFRRIDRDLTKSSWPNKILM